MTNDWKQFLHEQTIADPLASVALAQSDNDIICDLSHIDTLVVAGDDAASFMQGQFTNDVDKVDAEHSQLNAICNNKGRMIANFRLFSYQQNYFLSIDSSLTERSIAHLQNYILRAQVAIQDVSEQLIHLGVSGAESVARLSAFIDDLRTDADSVSANDDYIAIRIAGEQPRYEIFCQLEPAKALWQSLSEKASITSADSWQFLDIQAGLPLIDASTSEAFVPQMANMDLINGVSFSKGCFTGQEIIARTHYLGKQKRRCYRIKIVTDDQPMPGDQLATDTSTANQYTGTLVSVVQTGDKSYEALAVVQIKAAQEARLKLMQGDAEISLLELPYALQEKE